jgi:hypothetical protein
LPCPVNAFSCAIAAKVLSKDEAEIVGVEPEVVVLGVLLVAGVLVAGVVLAFFELELLEPHAATPRHAATTSAAVTALLLSKCIPPPLTLA